MTGKKNISTEEFLKRAKSIHDDLYDYSNAIYSRSKDKIHIVCKKHGSFYQKAGAHLLGQRCPTCAKETQGNWLNFTQEEFIKKVKKMHSDKYDYSETFFTMTKNKIDIICKKHGKFTQLAKNHIKGHGCPDCYGSKTRRLTTEKFIEKSKNVHGNLYDYSETKYVSRYNKVIIKCKKHGIFAVTPANHTLGKSGCPNCLKSKGENFIIKFLNENKIKYESQYKFKDCKNIKPLRFDFYLTELNMCIEYDGKQHFSSEWLGQKSLNQIQINDSIKNTYCEINNIPLLRIKFDDKNIEDKIKKFIK